MKSKIQLVLCLTLFYSLQLLNAQIDPIYVYPQSANYWTGTCNESAKTQVSLVNAVGNDVGWMTFDISSIPIGAGIVSVTLHGYLYANNWPYWSITPMGTVNPVTDSAASIYNRIINNYQQGVAYSYNQESGTLTNGWITRELGNGAASDLYNALLTGEWFSIGIVDWDFSTSYYVEFQGWQETNMPYLEVYISWCLSCVVPPSNLTAQVIYDPGPQVQLNWQDNSGDENYFNIFRKYGYPSDPTNYELIGTVPQNSIQFLDVTVTPESIYTYQVFSYNYWDSSGSNKATIAVPIPVELVSFTAEVDAKIVNLFWQTATETNNSGFEILRCAQNDKNLWERIGFVEGKGTTAEIQSYSFIDEPEPGKYKYRLKQIDYDGSFEYSQEIEAEMKEPLTFSLEQNYPNPFNPNTVISYQLPVNSNVTLKVYDIIGNEVAILVNEEQQPGSYEVEFIPESSIKHRASGIYFYQLQAGNFIETKKMILLK